jgi:hypothetical protein
LSCNNTNLTTLDVSGLIKLTTLNVIGIPTLTTLNCSNTKLTGLSVLGLTNLVNLNFRSCNFNQGTANTLAGQLVANGKNNGTLNFETQQSGILITITDNLNTLDIPPKNWTITV